MKQYKVKVSFVKADVGGCRVKVVQFIELLDNQAHFI